MLKDREYAGVGMFEREWTNPPAPFNPTFDPKAKERFEAVSASMQADDFYAGHSREECRIEWAARFDRMKEEGR